MPHRTEGRREARGAAYYGIILCALGATLSHRAVAEAPRHLSVKEVLSTPFPTELIAAPAGGAVAWVSNAEGVRNIWVAEPPQYAGRKLTAYAADDGMDIWDVCFSPDGGTIVYVRGGDSGMGGTPPNPASATAGVKEEVFSVALGSGAQHLLGEGRGPAPSAKGRVAFVKEGQVWSAPIDGSTPAGRLLFARGKASSLRWSPDGEKLAFVSNRGDHSYVAVYELGSTALRYMDPSVDLDWGPVWSPDSRRVAFVRTPAADPNRILTGPARTGTPWSIRIADASTGKGRPLFKAAPGKGSVFREVDSRDQLLWSMDDRIVFPWEQDGWTHLYAAPAGGGDPTLLTPGNFEVENVALAANGKDVLFSANKDDIDRRHLWRVAAAGGAVSAVTSGTGLEWEPAATSDGKSVAFLRSDARRPAHPALLTGPAARDLAVVPASFPETEMVTPQAVVFTAADGLSIHAQLFLPRDARPGDRRPAVVFLHGGPQRQMLLGWHYMRYYSNAYALNQSLASRGYVVLAVNYRSGTGYGMEFREALGYGRRGASELRDVLGAGLYLRSRPDVDPLRIALWGGSYGGYLTALGLSRASDLFSAGVDFHGVHDWNAAIRNFVPTYDPLKQPDVARLAFESSPMSSISTWRSPVLLIHGDDDRNVSFSETVNLVRALRSADVDFEELVFPDEVHGFLTHARWVEAYERTVEFLDRRLRAAVRAR